MKQTLYFLWAAILCVLLFPVLIATALWQQLWDALDATKVCGQSLWEECKKL